MKFQCSPEGDIQSSPATAAHRRRLPASCHGGVISFLGHCLPAWRGKLTACFGPARGSPMEKFNARQSLAMELINGAVQPAAARYFH
ncbi:hypothetical protein Dimus_000991, partial [Dionaea muscipula]